MSITRARSLADGGTGSGGGGSYSGGAFHGLRRDDEGKLIYNKVGLNDQGATVNLTDGSVFDDPTDFEAGSRNDANRKPGEIYDQWLIDSLYMNFYINDDGFLVASINEPYTYDGPK